MNYKGMTENDIKAQGFEFKENYAFDSKIYTKGKIGLLVSEGRVTFQYEV
jgi:hypothetical protein